jgi:Holliday junction DNA helicase RuvB
VPAETANAIADAVWNKLRSKDIRDCIKIGRLAKSRQDVEWIARTMRTYKQYT